MDFTITYEEFLTEKPISAKNLPERYIKVYSLYGKPKKKESYDKGELKYLSYYIDPNENLEKVLAENLGKIEIRTSEYIGEYLKTTYVEYSNGKLLFEDETFFSIHDKLGNEILFRSGLETTKSFFDHNGKELYVFFYINNELVNMDSYNPKHKHFTNSERQNFPLEELNHLEDFDWKQMVYFHYAEPIIPL